MKTTVLHFPENHSLGKLYLRDVDTRSNWIEFADAQGDIPNPCETELRLVISNNGSTNLAPILKLQPYDLQVIELTCATINENQLQFIRHLTGLRGLALWETNIGNTALSYISNLAELRWLDIGDTHITDNGLVHLKPLLLLEELSLLNTQVTDEGLVNLVKLPKLKRLDLMGTKISNKGIDILKKMKILRSLRIYDTDINELSYIELKNTLPECRIRFKHPHHV